MSRAKKTLPYLVSLALLTAGFLLSWWPLYAAGVLAAALWGRWIFALCIALVLDIAWGAPAGALAVIAMPATLACALVSLVRAVAARYMSSRALPERL